MHTRYLATWWLWNDGVNPDGDRDPIDDAHEVEQAFDYPHEARMFAQSKANEIERNNSGPWFSCRVVEQNRDDGDWMALATGSARGWTDAEGTEQWFESRSRKKK